jgi:hypothetical protein
MMGGTGPAHLLLGLLGLLLVMLLLLRRLLLMRQADWLLRSLLHNNKTVVNLSIIAFDRPNSSDPDPHSIGSWIDTYYGPVLEIRIQSTEENRGGNIGIY